MYIIIAYLYTLLSLDGVEVAEDITEQGYIVQLLRETALHGVRGSLQPTAVSP